MSYRILTFVCLILVLAGCGAANVPDSQMPAATVLPAATVVPTDAAYPMPVATAASTDAYPMATPDLPETTAYPAPTVEAVATTSAGDDVAGDVIAVWRREGGFAGFRDSITVYADGQIEVDHNGSVTNDQIAPATLDALKETFASPEWAALQPEYGQPFPDAFAYSIETGGKTVRTYDATPSPAVMETALQQFADLFGQ